MKKFLAISVLLLTNFGLIWAQQEVKKIETNQTEETTKVVINKKMIERFNSVDYPEDAVTLNILLSSYTFEELKLIAHTYHQDDLTLENEDILNEKLAEIKESFKYQDIRKSSIHNYLSETIIP